MNSPRKKVKLDSAQLNNNATLPGSPGSRPEIQVPASSPFSHQAKRSDTHGQRSGTIDLTESNLVAGSSDDDATSRQPVPAYNHNSAARDQTESPAARSPFPQRPPQQHRNAKQPIHNISAPHTATQVEMMRQHAQAFQYQPNSQHAAAMNHAAHNGFNHKNGAQGYQGYQGQPSAQAPQIFYQTDNKQIQHQYSPSPNSHYGPSMADQYSAGRPRQQSVQRGPAPIGQYHGHAVHNMNGPQQFVQHHGPAYNIDYGQQRNHQNTAEPAAMSKLSEVFPHLPDAILRRALIQARGNVADAQALIADDRVTIDLTGSGDPPQPRSMYGAPQQAYPNAMNQSRGFPLSTKREVKAPTMSIREKQALRTAQTYVGHPQSQQQFQYQNPYAQTHQQRLHQIQQQQYHHYQQQQQWNNQNRYQLHQNRKTREPIPVQAYEAPKLRTRVAKKGPKIEIGSDESDDDVAVELDSEGPDEDDKDSEDEEDDADVGVYLDFDRVALESRVLHYINTVTTAKELADLASCTEDVAQFIMQNRPFQDLNTIRELDQAPEGKRPSRTRKTLGTKVVDVSIDAMEGYEAIDSLVARCDEYGLAVKNAIAQWGIQIEDGEGTDGALGTVKIDADLAEKSSAEILYLADRPTLLPKEMSLKDYQLFGVNWLHLMYQKKLSGILADEMGLGKTCQVISFLGVLLDRGIAGPHLVVVPASTLENWLREISRFCPSLKVEAYYGSQKERDEFRDEFEGDNKREYNIMVTTYQLATGAKNDRSFLKRQAFDVCVYDEGHNLKNSASSRYKYLMALKANFRLLLTGTPLQNNLKELISLLSFVLPKVFAGNMDRLDSIFKIKAFGDSETLESALLSQERIKRAKTMMTPFILRRYKRDVLDDLPEKKYRIDYVELNAIQQSIYNEQLTLTKKDLADKSGESEKRVGDIKSAINIMMQLRKCANHPMLFRRQYDDKLLPKIARSIMKEETFKDSVEKLIVEDMEVMTDYELNRLCLRYPSVQQYALKSDCWMEACKVQHLKTILPKMKENGDRILLFSQFTQTLDILENCMDTLGISYFRLDGSTDVSARQDLIDQFHAEPDITVFLLSTKAGGFGINLACANVVIIYDSSFNPHDDKQAEDRAHRVGQKKSVQIIRLVAKDTIEEHIVRLANTKLALDSSVSGDGEIDAAAIAARGEKTVAQTLLSQLQEKK